MSDTKNPSSEYPLEADSAEEKAAPTWQPQDADRECIKQSIRDRVRNASLTDNATFIPAKPKPTIQDTERKRVAVYARVSTKSTEQVSSIENQTKYYTEKVDKNPNWEMQEIFSDEGKSGTSMRKRTEFQRMMQAAQDKKMDLILCASVSRFARNVSDCIEQVRLLKTMSPSHPVGVYFETENIYTLDPDCNQTFTMHAMLADWESANKSRRMILSYDQRICTGQYPVSDLLGYRHTTDGDLIIQEDEAVTVRFIYLAYLCGYSCEEIAEVLTEKQRKTLKGRTDWNAQMVRNVMLNERRWGDLNARKTIVIDYVKGKTVRNTQLRDAAFVKGHHTGIVTPQIAKATRFVATSGRYAEFTPDISVISQGALKGFVGISPTWSAINAETFQKVCRDVYSEEEYSKLQQDARILTGEEHSNVLSFQLSGYEVPHGVYFIGRNTPTLTISPRHLQFNKAARERFGHCTHIEVFYHPVLQALVIRPCSKDNPNAFLWESEDGVAINHLSTAAFSQSIYEDQSWIPTYRFKFRGITRKRGNSKMIMFFLDEPQILVGKRSKDTVFDATTSSAQYIAYKVSDGESETQPIQADGIVRAYPDEWRDTRIGMTYALRKRRDSLVDLITESDIAVNGTAVENPIIGSLPTKEEVAEELNQLLMSM